MINLKNIKKNKPISELLEFGIINIDKPSGPTSFDTSHFVKKILKLRKTSHFGTLDPKVTGVLPVALNRGCKLTKYFIGENKEYTGIMKIHKDIEIEKIQEKIEEEFLGEIIQMPPVKSRVKREKRKRKIILFDLLEKKNLEILFKVKCQGGTYIRKLIHDLGESLEIGAHMLELRRTQAGIFSEDDKRFSFVNLYELEKAVEEYEKENDEELRKIIIPGEIISELYPSIYIKEENKNKILTGKPIFKNDLEYVFLGIIYKS